MKEDAGRLRFLVPHHQGKDALRGRRGEIQTGIKSIWGTAVGGYLS